MQMADHPRQPIFDGFGVGVNVSVDLFSLSGDESVAVDGSVGVDVEGKHLIVGDALDNWIRPGVAHLFHDRGAARKSAEKIRALGDRTVYYGHGKPTKNGIF